MYPSATLCRAQQAIHLDRAAAAVLENVRAVAVNAAKAWGAEALAADEREARRERMRLYRLAHAPVNRDDGDDDDGDDFSENPDRGLTSA